jgi:hypothetical protein
VSPEREGAPAATPDSPGQQRTKSAAERAEEAEKAKKKQKHGWFGWRLMSKEEKAAMNEKGSEDGRPEPRPIRLFAPIYGGLGAGLSVFFIASGLSKLLSILQCRASLY